MTRWGVLELEVPPELEEEALALWAAESLGAETAEAPRGRREVRIYFADPQAAVSALEPALGWLRRRGAGGASIARARPVEDGRWVERYAESLAPFPVGRRFLVVPGVSPVETGGRLPIRIAPGRAFGTGEHPTTRLAIESLEERVEAGSRWLDAGTGSGILAVVAVHGGAVHVAACDTDPDALEVARRTFEGSGFGSRIELRLGSVEGFEGTPLDGVVANIGAEFFLERAGALVRALRPGGLLLATGFTSDDARGVEETLAAAGLPIEERREREEWCLLLARRVRR